MQMGTARMPKTKRGPVDSTLAVILLLLLLTGLLVLFSATYYTAQDRGDPLGEVKKQMLGIGLGTAAMVVTSRVPYRFWRQRWVIVSALTVRADTITHRCRQKP